METADNNQAFKHNAFISYSRQNDAFAAELQRALEIYKPPKGLDLPERYLDTFRDKEDFEAGAYYRRLDEHLKSSKKLIVICSPEARKSQFVNDEIRRFVGLRGAENIIPILYAGIPNNEAKSEQEAEMAFPAALCEVMDMPLAINYLDFRVRQDKISKGIYSDAWHTVLANLYDVGRSAIEQREKRRRLRKLRLVFSVLITSVAILSVLLVFALWSRAEAKRQRNEASAARATAEVRRSEAEKAQQDAEEQRNLAVVAKNEAVVAAEKARQAAEKERIAKAAEQKQRQNAERSTIRAQAAEKRAVEERDEARRQAFANASYALSEQDPTLALQLAAKAPSPKMSISGGLAVVKAFNTGSWFYSHRLDGSLGTDMSRDGTRLAWIDGKHLHIEELDTRVRKQVRMNGKYLRFLPSGNLIVWDSLDSISKWIMLLDPSGRLISRHDFDFFWQSPIVCNSGAVMIASGKSERGGVLVHRIDNRSGEHSTFNLPWDGGIQAGNGVCLPDGSGIALASNGGSILVGDMNGGEIEVPVPSNYSPSDIDIQVRDRRLAVYLAGAREGVTDAVGWIEFDQSWRNPSRIRIVKLPLSPTLDSGGRLRFLPDGRAIACSTDGWTRLINLDSGLTTSIDRKRAVDQIAVSPRGDFFVLARRSGTATIYTSQGFAIGQLLGEVASDGLNPAFDRVSFDDLGGKIITVTRNGSRLWHRPRYELSPLHSSSFPLFGKLPVSALASVKGSQSKNNPKAWIEPCPGITSLRLNDSGQLSLCISALGRTDYLGTTLEKNEFRLAAVGPSDATTYQLSGEDFDRLFVLSPELILKFVAEENRMGRLWTPGPAIIRGWVGQTAPLSSP